MVAIGTTTSSERKIHAGIPRFRYWTTTTGEGGAAFSRY
jgi:hypothetical protein